MKIETPLHAEEAKPAGQAAIRGPSLPVGISFLAIFEYKRLETTFELENCHSEGGSLVAVREEAKEALARLVAKKPQVFKESSSESKDFRRQWTGFLAPGEQAVLLLHRKADGRAVSTLLAGLAQKLERGFSQSRSGGEKFDPRGAVESALEDFATANKGRAKKELNASLTTKAATAVEERPGLVINGKAITITFLVLGLLLSGFILFEHCRMKAAVTTSQQTSSAPLLIKQKVPDRHTDNLPLPNGKLPLNTAVSPRVAAQQHPTQAPPTVLLKTPPKALAKTPSKIFTRIPPNKILSRTPPKVFTKTPSKVLTKISPKVFIKTPPKILTKSPAKMYSSPQHLRRFQVANRHAGSKLIGSPKPIMMRKITKPISFAPKIKRRIVRANPHFTRKLPVVSAPKLPPQNSPTPIPTPQPNTPRRGLFSAAKGPLPTASSKIAPRKAEFFARKRIGF